eukprot:scaffold55246_cov24-Tisochrysis_lutea.AAC.1
MVCPVVSNPAQQCSSYPKVLGGQEQAQRIYSNFFSCTQHMQMQYKTTPWFLINPVQEGIIVCLTGLGMIVFQRPQ